MTQYSEIMFAAQQVRTLPNKHGYLEPNYVIKHLHIVHSTTHFGVVISKLSVCVCVEIRSIWRKLCTKLFLIKRPPSSSLNPSEAVADCGCSPLQLRSYGYG